MGILSQVMVAAGFLLMLFNVTRAILFVRDQRDVVSGRSGLALSYIVLAFLVLFAIVYCYIFFQDFEEISIGVILLSGSMFVTIVLLWIIRLVGSIKRNTMEMATALTTVIEARDPNLRGHSQHVRRLTLALYDALPSDVKRGVSRTNLEYAAIFHDLGKLGVPESILNKPGVLTDEEWAIMRTHPQVGVQILSPVHSFDEIHDWILYHHERMDGKGYYGIPGDEIPFEARIIAVADVFSAVLMRRPYKDATSYEECIEVLRKAAGTQLDERLVDVFCSIPRDKIVACGRSLPDVEASIDYYVPTPDEASTPVRTVSAP